MASAKARVTTPPATTLRAPDPRPRRTRAAVEAGYVALVERRGADALNVADLIAESGVSRSAFYQHFASLDAVGECILEQLVHGIAGRDRAERSSSVRTGREVARDSLVELLRIMGEDATLYRHLLGDASVSAVRAHFVRVVSEGTRSVMELVRPGAAEAEAELIADVISGGLLIAVLRWLEADPRPEPGAHVDVFLETLPAWLVSQDA